MPDVSILDKLNDDKRKLESNVRLLNSARSLAKANVRSVERQLKDAKQDLYRLNKNWVLERKRLARVNSKIKVLPSYLRSQSKKNSGKVLNKILGGD